MGYRILVHYWNSDLLSWYKSTADNILTNLSCVSIHSSLFPFLSVLYLQKSFQVSQRRSCPCFRLSKSFKKLWLLMTVRHVFEMSEGHPYMIAINGGHAVLYLWVNSRVELFTFTLRLCLGRRFAPNTNSLLGLAIYSWIAIRVYETMCVIIQCTVTQNYDPCKGW